MLTVGAVLVGLGVVGPALNREILRWVGRRVVVAALLGRAPSWREVAPAAARCAGCGHALEVAVAGPFSLLPWAVAGGRCRGCGAWRPAWMAGVETATGALFGAAAARIGWSAELPAVLVLLAGLVAVSAVDLVYLRIPTRFIHLTGAAAAVAIGTAAVAAGPVDALAGAALGGAVYAGFLGALYLVSPTMLGFGDVRLGALIGAVVGWLAWAPDHPVEGPLTAVLRAAFVAGLVGTVAGTILLVVRRQNRPFPFGPAMAVGAVFAVLVPAIR
jgi:prepilin signal peptidase PulO-like enzyme (type II secretory pathway)